MSSTSNISLISGSINWLVWPQPFLLLSGQVKGRYIVVSKVFSSSSRTRSSDNLGHLGERERRRWKSAKAQSMRYRGYDYINHLWKIAESGPTDLLPSLFLYLSHQYQHLTGNGSQPHKFSLYSHYFAQRRTFTSPENRGPFSIRGRWNFWDYQKMTLLISRQLHP